MPKAFMDITPELLTEIFKGLKSGGEPWQYRVVKNELPADAKVVNCSLIRLLSLVTMRMEIESEHVKEGDVLPAVQMESVDMRPSDIDEMAELERLAKKYSAFYWPLELK